MDLQLDAYCLHYFLDAPHLAYMNSNSIISETSAKKLKYTQYLQYEVPNVFRFVYDIINKKSTRRYPCISLVNDTSKKIVQVSVCRRWFVGAGDNEKKKTIVVVYSKSDTIRSWL